ncbi:hypothetical protein PTTG_27478 [Puccinia triticina 1-1 BBBD Race 1]|uniref:Uncharacterized protein n=1 Tax=Puccinia triticina (isolate 1-1 / race 1 (BBBD)) TaxID=630390 RepID=A0A180GKP5_PUCT1|nr:hypothetical protein PTTG_27478 [Puccinia triticina 1-1 BBBD Race 1]
MVRQEERLTPSYQPGTMQSNRALKSTRSLLDGPECLNFRGEIFVEEDISEVIFDWDVVKNNLLWASLRSKTPGAMPFFSVNLRASVFGGTNIASRRNYWMKGSIIGFSTDGAIELAFRSATALPTLETTCHSEGNHLLVNALGTIVGVSVATGDGSGLGPEYSIKLVHEV